MAAPYIPTQDGSLDVWAGTFASAITASPGDFGLDAPAASTIQAAVDAYHAAYLIGGLTPPPMPHPVNPALRTPTTVAAKNTAKLAMVPIVRTYANQIRINPGVSDANKIAIGLNLPNNAPSPIPAPSTAPVLTITQATPLRHTLRFRDEVASPSSRAKAPNAVGCQIWVGTSTIALTDPSLASFYGVAVKVPFTIEYEPSQVGKIATVFSRWVNRAGSAGNNIALTGPWGSAVSLTVVGTG